MIRNQIEQWLISDTHALAANEYIVATGDLSSWGKTLLTVLKQADHQQQHPALSAAHQSLEVLTHTQRSQAPYSGHVSLLIQDWQDTIEEQLAHVSRASPLQLSKRSVSYQMIRRSSPY